MEIDYFKKVRILDGGMGQELLARGMKPNGTLWSANDLFCLLYTSPSPRDATLSRMPSSA